MRSESECKLSELPDLPGLEMVEVGYRAITLGAVATIAGMATLFGLMLLWLPHADEYRAVLIIGAGGMLSVALCTAYRGATSGCYWKTDSEGVTERALIAVRRIAWSDVERIERRDNALSGPAYRLHAGRVHVDIASGVLSYQWLGGSAWQHLRRVGKSDGFVMHGPMLSFWDTIPDDVLQPVEVSGRVPDDAKIWPFLWTLCTAAAFVLGSDSRQTSWPWITLACGVAAAVMVWLLIRHAPVRRYIMDAEALHILGRRPRVIPWSSMTSIGSGAGPYYTSSVRTVTTSEGKISFVVPQGKDESSRRAQLAWIRHMREQGLAMMIPENLRLRAPAVLDVPDQVDIRLPRLYAWFLPCLFGSVAVLLPLIPRPRPWGIENTVAVSLMAVGAATAALAASRYHICGDQSGLLKTSLFGTRYLPWDEVSSYEKQIQGGYSFGATLKDARGRVLRLTASGSNSLKWDMLTALMESKVPHFLLACEEQPSWLARPFNWEDPPQDSPTGGNQ